MVERGEVFGALVITLFAFCFCRRVMNGQLVSMNRSWREERRQVRDNFDRTAREI